MTSSTNGVNGLHHITAIAGPAQENLDFYAGVLGMRLVKRSVNQDDPETYHLFYADADGHPGSDLTFFPWAQMAPSRPGHGLAMAVGLEVPQDTLGYWSERLQRYGTHVAPPETRFGQKVLAFTDPHGLNVALTEAPGGRPFTPWAGSPVPSEHQIRGLHGAQLWERDASATARFLTDILGFLQLGTENGWTRYGFKGSAGVVDVRDRPDTHRGGWGVGSVHHLAWRVDDEAHQADLRARTRHRSSIAFGSSRCTSRNPAACCSSWRPTVRVSPSTKTRRTSARRLSCRPGSKDTARRSSRRCRR